jgi:3-methyl-2-oxobutanoate hydroxymethyltransferase
MGHIGLTPQGVGVLGGFRAQGRTAVKAKSIVDDALALQNAGAFALGTVSAPLIKVYDVGGYTEIRILAHVRTNM